MTILAPGSELRVVLVGYGLAGRVFHAPLVSRTEGMRLTAVVTSNLERQGQLSNDLPDVDLIASSHELAERADEFDLAVIATSTGSHVVEALRAIRSGLHVVIEKPVAGTAAEAEMLRLEAARSARQVHVFHNRRWDSDFLGIRALKEAGILGKPLVLESRMESLRPVHSASWRNSPNPQESGGSLLDLGSHLVDQAIQLMGPVESVSATTQAVRVGAEANDFSAAMLMHEGTATSLLIASKATPFMECRFKILGTRAAARVGWADSQERALREGRNPASSAWGEEPSSAVVQVCGMSAEGEPVAYSVPAPRGEWNEFYPGVLRAVRGDQPPLVPMEDAIETMRVLDAARKSADEGTAVRLTPPAGHVSNRATRGS